MNRMLKVKDVAQLLLAKASTIYAWVEQGLIPYYKLNGMVRFDEAELLQWIQSQKKPAEYYNNSTGRRPRKGG